MYKSLNKTKQKYSELETHETLKRVASANAILKHYKSSSLITVNCHAMAQSFFLKAIIVPIKLSMGSLLCKGHMCGSRKFFRGGPTLTTFLADEGKEDPNNTTSGPPSARQQNAI